MSAIFPNKKSITLFLIALLYTATVPLLLQFLHLQSFQETVHWFKYYKSAYYINLLIVSLPVLFFYALSNSIIISMVVTSLSGAAFIIADMQKMRILHQPLLPSDLLFIKQALIVTRYYIGGFILFLGGAAVALTIYTLFRKRLPHLPLPKRARVSITALVAFAFVFCGSRFDSVTSTINRKMSLVDEFWNQLSNFKKNGVLYAFLLNSESLTVKRPTEYGRTSVDRIFRKVSPPESQPSADATPPDVIIYMNESFWDITSISELKLPHDPIPHYHAHARHHPTQKFISPTFGGNTCYAEFEILTGMSYGYFPQGASAYNQFIHHSIPSLVHVFNENGYNTIGLHSFKRWFWNRGNVFRHLGFDEFISVESMDDAYKKGKFISDESLAQYIIKTAAASESPFFMYALSMQNHGPYDEERYDSLDHPVTTSLSATANREVNTYIQGLTDADRSLKMVTDYIDTTSRKTMLIFFGDHLPGFVSVYDETGYGDKVRSWSLWSRTTKALWYSNFPLTPFEDSTVSMVYLPILAAKQAGISVPRYYTYMDDYRKQYPVFSHKKRYDHTGKPIPSTRETRTDDIRHWSLVYDALLGKNYGEQYYHVSSPAPESHQIPTLEESGVPSDTPVQ